MTANSRIAETNPAICALENRLRLVEGVADSGIGGIDSIAVPETIVMTKCRARIVAAAGLKCRYFGAGTGLSSL